MKKLFIICVILSHLSLAFGGVDASPSSVEMSKPMGMASEILSARAPTLIPTIAEAKGSERLFYKVPVISEMMGQRDIPIDEVEPNDNCDTVQDLGALVSGDPHVISGSSNPVTDPHDFFRFTSDAGFITLFLDCTDNLDLFLGYCDDGDFYVVMYSFWPNCPEVIDDRFLGTSDWVVYVDGQPAAAASDYILTIAWLACSDADGDDYFDEICGGSDCDDTNAAVNPNAEEICDDEIDNDCNNLIDGDDPDCFCDFPDELISCGGVVTGSTIGGDNVLEKYSCSPYLSETGPEYIYVLPITETVDLTITLNPLGGADLDLFLLSDDPDGACQSNCFDYSAGFGQEVITFDDAIPGTYLVVVDGYLDAENDFELFVDCTIPTCDEPDHVIGCDIEESRTTEGEDNVLQHYAGLDKEYTGPEYIYSFSTDDVNNVFIKLTGMDYEGGVELDLLLLADLDEGACDTNLLSGSFMTLADELLYMEALPAGDYFIVIEGYNGSACEFDLSINCCLDADGDGYTGEEGEICVGLDCNDTDPTIHTCATEIPGDGIDQDCSGDDRPAIPGAYHEIEPNDDILYFSDATYVGEYVIGTSFVVYGRICSPDDFDGFVFDIIEFGNFTWKITRLYGIGEEITDCGLLSPSGYAFGVTGEVGDYVLEFTLGESVDADGDGIFSTETCGDDCDDSDPSINPCVEEIPDNGIDENCTGFDLTNMPEAEVEPNNEWISAQDLGTLTKADLLTISGYMEDGSFGLDFYLFTVDGSGLIDMALSFDCSLNYDLYLFREEQTDGSLRIIDASCAHDVPELIEDTYLDTDAWGFEFGIFVEANDTYEGEYVLEVFFVGCDHDGDVYMSEECGGSDCDDIDPTINPGANEGAQWGNNNDGVDNDCDGQVDEYCFIRTIM